MIVIDSQTLDFATWNLLDVKHFCIIGKSCYDRKETAQGSHGEAIYTILQRFLAWYDSHWLQPNNLPVIMDDQQHDWILSARELASRFLPISPQSCEVM